MTARKTTTGPMMMTTTIMTPLLLLVSVLAVTAQGSADGCVPGDNEDNTGGSCNFGTTTSTLCKWQNMEANNLTWKTYYNDVNLSPCVLTDTKDLDMNEIVRLKSPLLCATNSSFRHQLYFDFSLFDSDRCRFSLSVFSAAGDKLAEIWNTQKTTYDPRSTGWKTQNVNVSNDGSSFYLIFAAERISSTVTTTVGLDTLRYISSLIPTTTATTTTTPAPTSPHTPPTSFSTTSPSTDTPAVTTLIPTAKPTSPPTSPLPTTGATESTTVPGDDDTLIWGLSKEVIIAIGVGVGVVILLILIIAIICRRVRREEEVKTVSFALASPTAYNVNEDKKLTNKRRKEMKARASVLVPSKHSNWRPDRPPQTLTDPSLY